VQERENKDWQAQIPAKNQRLTCTHPRWDIENALACTIEDRNRLGLENFVFFFVPATVTVCDRDHGEMYQKGRGQV